ncbi:DNA/RNA non-specific endonuclease [Croceitalea dokdonensis]|nr:DNA/RNA non-specific endonuclease [Croceitalea dokdonensis]
MLLCVIVFWLVENFYTPAPYSPDKSSGQLPFKSGLLPASTTNAVVMHEYYMLSYSEEHEQAEWLAYELKKEQLTLDDRKRPYFIEDPKVRSKSADWRNYKGSGFDRGHLCPAGDRRFSKLAYNETFYTSNIAPQDRDFNAGLWNRLEMKVRSWCKQHGHLYVITGGILEDGLQEIGEEDVDVPNYFYKIVCRFDGKRPKALAFIMPNREFGKPLEGFLVSVDELEKRTGIDFFYQQSQEWQQTVESKVRTNGWDF